MVYPNIIIFPLAFEMSIYYEPCALMLMAVSHFPSLFNNNEGKTSLIVSANMDLPGIVSIVEIVK